MKTAYKPSSWPTYMDDALKSLEKGTEPKPDPTAKRLESIESKLDKLMKPAYMFEGERYVKSNGLFVPLGMKD